MFGERFLKDFDIVALQEMYSYGSSRQSRMVHFAKRNGFDYYVSSPSKSVFNTQYDGGLMILSKYPIVRTEKMTFKKGGSGNDRLSARGAIYAKIALTSSFAIHVFTTHLSTGKRESDIMVRKSQVGMIKEFIDECTARKASSEPIILMGDFSANARAGKSDGAHSKEYTAIKDILGGTDDTSPYNISDLVYEAYGEHPITYGDIDGRTPKETVLTCVEDLGAAASNDYIFWMNCVGEKRLNEEGSAYKIPASSTHVERFLVAGLPFTQVSDHYGVSTTFSVV